MLPIALLFLFSRPKFSWTAPTYHTTTSSGVTFEHSNWPEWPELEQAIIPWISHLFWSALHSSWTLRKPHVFARCRPQLLFYQRQLYACNGYPRSTKSHCPTMDQTRCSSRGHYFGQCLPLISLWYDTMIFRPMQVRQYQVAQFMFALFTNLT